VVVVDPVVVVVVPVVDVPVVVVVDVVCRIDAGLLPATTAAAKAPTASIRHTAIAVPKRRMRATPLSSKSSFAAACATALMGLLTPRECLNAVSFGERKGTFFLFPRNEKEREMAQVAKVVTIIGSSPESFAKAADAAVKEASKTLRGITGADVVSMSALVEGDSISEYRTTVNIAFAIERS
jgi:flavin-binding protein dodecin